MQTKPFSLHMLGSMAGPGTTQVATLGQKGKNWQFGIRSNVLALVSDLLHFLIQKMRRIEFSLQPPVSSVLILCY
jgi:hypothetical protein